MHNMQNAQKHAKNTHKKQRNTQNTQKICSFPVLSVFLQKYAEYAKNKQNRGNKKCMHNTHFILLMNLASTQVSWYHVLRETYFKTTLPCLRHHDICVESARVGRDAGAQGAWGAKKVRPRRGRGAQPKSRGATLFPSLMSAYPAPTQWRLAYWEDTAPLGQLYWVSLKVGDIYISITIISVNFNVSLDALLFWLMMSFFGHHLFVVLMKHKLVCGQCSLIDVVCFQVRILQLMKTLKKQGYWFGIIMMSMPLNGVQSNQGGAENIICTFCDASFTTCFSSRAFTHILGRDVLGHKRPNVGTCVPKLKLGMLVFSQVISA